MKIIIMIQNYTAIMILIALLKYVVMLILVWLSILPLNVLKLYARKNAGLEHWIADRLDAPV